ILEERSMRVDGNPSSLLSEQMRARLHAGTAYAVPVIGWRKEIEQLNTADARAFYERFYAPDNAVLVVAGAVTLDDVLPLAEAHYGPLTPSSRPRDPRRVATDLTVADFDRVEVLADSRVRQASWRRMYRLPQYSRDERRLYAAADVLAEIIGNGSTGRLYEALVVDKKLAVSVGAYSDTARLDNGEFVLYASLTPGSNFTDVATAMDAVLADAKNRLPTQDEMARAKMQLVSDLVYARDSQQSMANIFGQAAMLGLTPQEIIDWPNVIESVTAEDVRRAAQLFLQRPHAIDSHLLPQDVAQ
ncbi:MAG: M16 family metallopeptidase, partial [Parvibaculales bacterium]